MVTLIAETESYAANAIRRYRALGPVHFWFEMGAKERKAVLPEVELLVVRLAVNVTEAFIDEMPRLKCIATSTTGLNHIDVAHAEEKGIEIISLRGRTDFLKLIPSTAEETMALTLALIRRIPWAFDAVKRGEWNANRWTGNELKGKTMGLIGFGRLGSLVAGYARAFGMVVVACDPNVSKAAMAKRGVKKVALDALLKNSDIVSLHVLLTEGTTGMLRRNHFKIMKADAIFINTARAELIEPGALHRALEAKEIVGAAVDVLDGETSDASHLKKDSLWKYAKGHENLIIVPHIGGTTKEAKETTQNFLAEIVAKRVRKFLGAERK